MEIVLVAAGTLLLCWLVDKGFTKVFRSKPQHMSGKAVRLNKLYGAMGLILAVLGVSALFAGASHGWFLTAGGIILLVLGIGLVVYYMTFGVYYDDDSFVLTTFGRKSATYRYRDIQGQLLFTSGGHILIELHLTDGRAVQLQSNMIGVYPFLDSAFAAWLRQTGKRKEDCAFHDPDNSCWFPSMEG